MQIPQYTETAELHPNDTGMEVAAQAGRRIGSFYHQIGDDIGGAVSQLGDQYQKQVAIQEVSKVQAQAATTFAGLSKSWNDIASSADPNDTTIGDKFKVSMEDTLSKLGDGVSTPQAKEYVRQETAQIRQHMYERTAADMSTRAGDAAVGNFTAANNARQSAVLEDPTSLDLNLGLTDGATEALISGHGLTPDKASALRLAGQESKTQLAKAAVMGTIMKGNTGAAMSMLDDPKLSQYLNADEKERLGTFATEWQEKQVRETQLQAEQVKRQQEAVAEQKAMSISSMIQVGPDGKLVAAPGTAAAIQEYDHTPGAIPGRSSAMKEQLEHALKGDSDVADNEDIRNQFFARMNSDGVPLTAKDVVNAELQGQLSHKTAELFMRGVDASDKDKDPHAKIAWADLEDFRKQMTPFIAPKQDAFGRVTDPTQADQLREFNKQLNDLWTMEVIDGKMAPEDFVQKHLTPGQPGYFGNYIGRFQRGTTIQQRTDQQQQAIKGVPTPVPSGRYTPQQTATLNAKADAILHKKPTAGSNGGVP